MSTKGIKQSAELIQKRVNSRRGYHPPEESRRKMSIAKSGVNNPFYGKHWKESSKKKLRISMAGYKHSEETKEKIRAARIRFYQEHPEIMDRYKGQNSPMFKEHDINSNVDACVFRILEGLNKGGYK